MLELLSREQNTIINLDDTPLKLTHLNKVYWPDEGYTKGDLINYYLKISNYILPYLKDRPESLHRFPNGIKGKSFYQKNVYNVVPSWAKTIPISSDNGRITNYLIANDIRSLVFMANLGCIEINPWNSKLSNLDQPDYLVIDLDPEEITFDYVVKTAQACRKIFQRLGIISFPKTSGASGLHIYIPLGARFNYEQVRIFAQILVTLVHNEIPDFTSLERSPKKKAKKSISRLAAKFAWPNCSSPVFGPSASQGSGFHATRLE